MFSTTNEPPKAKAGEQKSATEQRGSERSPLFVKAASPSTQAERDYETYEKYQKPWNEKAITYATIALAVITLALAVFTAFLWNATRRIVIDAQDTARRQLRAYVSIRGAEAQGDAVQPRFTVELVNCGQTPAHEMTAWIGSAFRDLPLKDTLKPMDAPSHKESVGPSVPSLLRKSLKRGFLPEEIQQMRNNTHALYIFGRCDYKDVFGVKHFTDFRFIYRDTVGEGAGLQRYKEGNDSD